MHSPGADRYEEELRATLPVAGLGDPCRYVESTESTNDLALAWAKEGAPHGAIVVADHQTAGRGRRGRTWHAPAGSALLFTLILRPRLDVGRLGLLTTALGIAGARAMSALGAQATIKWPNDVVVSDRKIAGILVETRLSGADIDVAAAGVGLNVRVESADLPPPVDAEATSLHEHAEDAPARAAVLDAFLHSLAPLLDEMRDDPAAVVHAAAELSAVIDRAVTVRMGDGRSLSGVARRLSPAGALIVEVEGREVEVGAGEIERLRTAE